MKKRKQILALLLSFSLVLGMCGSGFAAQDVRAEEGTEEVSEEEDKQPEISTKEETESMTEADEMEEEIARQNESSKQAEPEKMDEAEVSDDGSKAGQEEEKELQTQETVEGEEYTFCQYITINDDEKTEYDEGRWYSAYVGDRLTFEVEATSGDDLAYRWYSEEDYETTVSTGAQCTFQKKYNVDSYYCEIYCGEDWIDTLYFCVFSAWTINSYSEINGEQVDSIALGDGETVTMEVHAKTSYPGGELTYKWYKGDEDWTYDSSNVLSESSGYKATKTGVKSERYCCVLSDGNVEETIWFTLAGNLLQGCQYVDGKLLDMEEDINFDIGTEHNIKVDVTPVEGYHVSYNWYNYDNDEESIGTGDNLTVSMEKGDSWEEYCCHVELQDDESQETVQEKNYYFYLHGNSTIEYNVLVNAMDYDYWNSDETKFAPGTGVTMEIQATSSKSSEISYQWYNADDYWDGDGIVLSDKSVYQVVKNGDRWEEYICVISDGYTSKNVYIEFWRTPVISGNQWINGVETSDGYLKKGDTCKLEVKAVSANGEALTYAWTKWVDDEGWVLLPDDSNTSAYSVTKQIGYEEYRCEVSIADGTETEYFHFNLVPDSLSWIRRINGEETEDSYAYLEDGERAVLKVEATSDYGSNAITYEWMTYDEWGDAVVLSTANSLTVTQNKLERNSYWCNITDGDDTQTIWFYVVPNTLSVKGSINGKETVEAVVSAEEETTLKITADSTQTASEKITYEWWRATENDDEWIAEGRGKDTLQITRKDDSEKYYCYVNDGYSSKIVYFYLYGNEAKPIVKVSNIQIKGISKSIAAGKSVQLSAVVSPSNATDKSVIWSVSNSKYAKVTQSGKVTLLKKSAGKKVTVYATAKDGSGKKASYVISSKKGVVKNVAISGSKSVKAGKSLKLKAKVTATKGANKELKWTSSNTKYATVSASGKVKTYKAGKGKKVKITAMATDGSNKKKTITIKIK